METRKHIHQEEFPVSPEKMFEILITPSAIRHWWNASRAIVLAEENGVWTAAWGEDEDDPDYITSFVIKEFEPPKRMLLVDAKYHAKYGKMPFDAKMTTEFNIEPTDDGSVLRVVQDGFPVDSIADEYYQACETGWIDTFKMIRTFLSV